MWPTLVTRRAIIVCLYEPHPVFACVAAAHLKGVARSVLRVRGQIPENPRIGEATTVSGDG